MGLLTYTLSDKTRYNLVLSGLAFTHMSFLEYYHSDDQLIENLRSYVDRFSNCEDIALNFVASMLTCEGPLLVLGRDALIRQPDERGISKTPGHISKRNHCLREFTNWFTYRPLQSVSGWTRRGAEVIG
jgi:glucuronyl/N-acetylglucosaminyl transferase EXT2/alpha-1,4-N-acetylglucosaminyltransferase EXTL3